jgi:radical SAM protein with 4Fe4S-binding SPASM domain
MTHPTVLWEITRACALECTHCPKPDDDGRPGSEELSTYEAYKTIDQIGSLAPRQFIITGGDPLARPDLLQIIDYAKRRGLKPAVALSATPNLTPQAVDALRANGATTLIFALNGSSPLSHDVVSGVPGAFQQTLKAIRAAVGAGIPVEIDTLITRRNVSEMNAIADLLASLGIEAWNVHFVVPVGNARKLEILTADEAERVFEVLATVQRNNRFRVRTVEAPEYRRYLLQNRTDAQWADFATDCPEEIADCSIDDVVFIGANGAVRPSELLPIAAGNIRFRPLFGIVRGSDLFVAFRDRGNLTGKCARCEFKEVCGGSRARAWAMTGLLFGPDPLCVYQPKRTLQEATS